MNTLKRFQATLIQLILCTLVSLAAVAQTNAVKSNIDKELIKSALITSDTSIYGQYQNFAMHLFLEGEEIPESFFKQWEKRLIGVCLMTIDAKKEKGKISLNLYSMDYKDSRENDFHKRIYFPGMEGMYNFYVKCNSDEELKMVKEAVAAYLYHDSIPKANLAYQFCETYEAQDDRFEQVYHSKENEEIVVGMKYSYLRKKGNYLIQLELHPVEELGKDPENAVLTENILKNWDSITVFILDDSSGKAYGQKF